MQNGECERNKDRIRAHRGQETLVHPAFIVTSVAAGHVIIETLPPMAGILKGLAIAGGAGITAFVVLSRAKQESVAAPAEHAQSPAIASCEQRVEAQQSEIRSLRIDVDETHRRIDAQVEFVERRFREISSSVDARLDASIAEMQSRLECEIEHRFRDSIAILEETNNQNLSNRIAPLEKTLLEQSASIGALRERADTTEKNLQRLISAVERLCERTQPAPESFQAQLDQAMRNPDPDAFLPRFIREAEATERKSRAALPRTLIAVLTFGIARLLR